jgi:hypothetical protein
MAVQSTMQPINTMIYNHQHLNQSEQSFDSTATSPIVPMSSTASHSALGLPLADPFTLNTIPISHEGHTNMHNNNYYGGEPCDGGSTVWYCSSCGDGPIGSWNPVCTCGHAYCGACTVEKVA